MAIKKVTFRILRCKRGQIDPPRYQNFDLEILPHMTVLDGLEKIRLKQDHTLMYRHSCHHSSCGTCACRINESEKLACTTNIHQLGAEIITLTPLQGFRVQGDLVVEMDKFYEDFSENWTHIRKCENPQPTILPDGIQQFTRFENCIECGACVSACPVTRKNKTFLGPAVLAAIHHEIKKTPEKKEELFSLAASKRGVTLCERALKCSRVCPTGVFPARKIEELRKLKISKRP